ncbi:unnamed protein product [Peronospora farinosa]|uniref:Elicitin n=1 Tax=Peronospora farinosa TaxID=134698 RepID=A0AAV0SRP1_9STRA|nr:unnamed protein product [Peronospora farinosa]CAI5706641.1 unnamed protein product [Peronospora farinosa]
MNTYFTFAVAALSIISSVYAEKTYSQMDCMPEETQKSYLILSPMLSDVNLDTCSKKTNYNFMSSTSLPSEKKTKEMCAAKECVMLIDKIKALGPVDCKVLIPTSNLKVNILEMTSTFDSKCKTNDHFGVHAYEG